MSYTLWSRHEKSIVIVFLTGTYCLYNKEANIFDHFAKNPQSQD